MLNDITGVRFRGANFETLSSMECMHKNER